MTRAYLRLDPGFDEHKHAYPDGAYAALIATFCLAESQPQRGRFRSLAYFKALLGERGRWAKFLLEHGDVVQLSDGRIYVEGWDEWQEGDWKVGERLDRIRTRRGEELRTPGATRTANWRLRTKIFERDEFTCRYCGIADYPREWLVLEHVVPDGPSTEDNLVTACRGCNKLKGGRTPEQAGMVLRALPGDASHSDVTHSGDASPTVARDASPLTSRRSDGRRLSAGAGAGAGGALAETESLSGEDRTKPQPAPERADIQALLDRGWRQVTEAQRAILDEVLELHDVTGPEWAAQLIRDTPASVDPLDRVKRAHTAWQWQHRQEADAQEAEAADHRRGQRTRTATTSGLERVG